MIQHNFVMDLRRLSLYLRLLRLAIASFLLHFNSYNIRSMPSVALDLFFK